MEFEPGHLYLLPQYGTYSMRQDPTDPFYVLWQHVRVSGRFVKKMIDVHIVDGSAVWHILHAMERLTNGMLVESLSGAENITLIEQLTRLLETLLSVLEAEVGCIFCAFDQRLDGVWSAISQEGVSNISVSSMAAAVRMERSYFSRLFRQQLGMSPQQWLVMARITEAASLLLNGKNVGEAAASVGYTDAKAFSRAFSQQMRISPSIYRKSHILQP